jgi:hypothetical protein
MGNSQDQYYRDRFREITTEVKKCALCTQEVLCDPHVELTKEAAQCIVELAKHTDKKEIDL